MNFNPGRASQPGWYGGKFVVASETEYYIAFDDDDLRAFDLLDLQEGFELGTLETISDDARGLVDGMSVDFKAEE
eukprot:1096428-Pleurochrysis_carterae.AAC.1